MVGSRGPLELARWPITKWLGWSTLMSTAVRAFCMLHLMGKFCLAPLPPPFGIFSVVCNTQELYMESSWRSTVEVLTTLPWCLLSLASVCTMYLRTGEYEVVAQHALRFLHASACIIIPCKSWVGNSQGPRTFTSIQDKCAPRLTEVSHQAGPGWSVAWKSNIHLCGFVGKKEEISHRKICLMGQLVHHLLEFETLKR